MTAAGSLVLRAAAAPSPLAAAMRIADHPVGVACVDMVLLCCIHGRRHCSSLSPLPPLCGRGSMCHNVQAACVSGRQRVPHAEVVREFAAQRQPAVGLC
jgi:hypothetical protein